MIPGLENKPNTPEATPHQPVLRRVPLPQAHEPANIQRKIKATVLSGSGLIDSAIKFLKSTFIGKIFSGLFPTTEKPNSISLQDANYKILTDAKFAKKFGAALNLYLNREEKIKLFNELNRLQKNFSDQEKTNLKAFIDSYIKHSDNDEIEYLEFQPGIPAFFNQALGKSAHSDTVMERYRHLTSASGQHPLATELNQIRRGTHLNRDEFIELMASSITKNGQAAFSKIRAGELAELARTDILKDPDKFPSLRIVLENSENLMEAIKGDILQDDDRDAIANILEFYIELANQLASRGDANGFIIVLAVILDPEMDPIIKNVGLSSNHQELLKKLESKAESIDSFGNFKDNPSIPSGRLLVDRFKDVMKGRPLDVVSDEIMGPLDEAMTLLENIPVSKDSAIYDLEDFIRNRSVPLNPAELANRLESDIDQIYSVLERAQNNQKLRFTPDGLVAKERSIFSRFTNKLAGKKDPAKNAVQYVLAKMDRALDQDPAPLVKIGHIINFLHSHTWSKIVLNKNENLNKILDQLEQKYLSKIDKTKAAETLHNQTYNGLRMVQSFLKDIDDTRHLQLIKGFSGAFNIRSNTNEVSEETLQNFYTLLKNAENDPELKELAKEVIESLFKRPWFEAALDKHKEVGDDIIQLARVMERKWISPEELK